uniref:Pseudouridine synthase RsuA/RluA-like domain-containing protein n=1 Tax=Vitrella brassicaformis TaxID=1169539 RepID=A0A7S1PCU5_9ALVE
MVHGRVPAGQHWAADKLKTESGELYSTTSVEEDGRVAVTYYECLGHLQRTPTEAESDSAGACSEGSASMMSLVRVRLITGRTHQIRVHLSNTGYPLVGENRYATARQIEDDKTWVPRLFLHCHNLRFCDLQGQPVDVSCPLPSDLQDVLRQLQPVHLIES